MCQFYHLQTYAIMYKIILTPITYKRLKYKSIANENELKKTKISF